MIRINKIKNKSVHLTCKYVYGAYIFGRTENGFYVCYAERFYTFLSENKKLFNIKTKPCKYFKYCMKYHIKNYNP